MERRIASAERYLPRIHLRDIGKPSVNPIEIRIGRGNVVYNSGGSFKIYGCASGANPTAIAGAMWDSGTNAVIPLNDTYTSGICYGYTSASALVFVALKFNSIQGQVTNAGALTEGAIVYSKSSTYYTLGADAIRIYLVDRF